MPVWVAPVPTLRHIQADQSNIPKKWVVVNPLLDQWQQIEIVGASKPISDGLFSIPIYLDQQLSTHDIG